jgi:hypothetical protein
VPEPPTPDERALAVHVAKWLWAYFECARAGEGANRVEFAAVLGVPNSTITHADKAANKNAESFPVSGHLFFCMRKVLGADINKAIDRAPTAADRDVIEEKVSEAWANSPIVLARRQSRAAGDPTPKRRRRASA